MNIMELVKRLVNGLVWDKRSAIVTECALQRSTILTIQVGKHDQGKVLGQQRSTLDALIAVSEEAGDRHGKLVRIELLEPTATSKTPPTHKFVAQENWDKATFEKLLKDTSEAIFCSVAIEVKSASPTITVFEIRVPNDAPNISKVPRLQRSFEALFHGIGKSMKHVVHVDLISHPK